MKLISMQAKEDGLGTTNQIRYIVTDDEYYTDANNNRWDLSLYTPAEARTYSESMINSKNCTNCAYLTGCNNCISCRWLEGCRNCEHCKHCIDALGCIDCSGCVDCQYVARIHKLK